MPLAQAVAAGAGNGRAPSLSWVNLDTISVRFTEPVNVQADDLRVAGVRVSRYGLKSFAYDPNTLMATWTLAAPIGLDKVALDFANGTGTDLAGNRLAVPLLRLDVVPGDVDGSGRVDAFDTLGVKASQGANAAWTYGYPWLLDVDGNGRIDAFDTLSVKAKQGSAVNQVSGEPAPAAATFGAEEVLQKDEHDPFAALLG
jgi:hypothetical protein